MRKNYNFLIFCLSLLMVIFFNVSCDSPTPCDGVDCSGHGDCRWTSDETLYCNCDNGYFRPTDKPTLCLQSNTSNANNTKPVIYLYPTEETMVSVRFKNPDRVSLTYTYPLYPEEGWNVTAHPDGSLEDPLTGRKYYALYWEGIIDEPIVPETGTVISPEEIIPFLEEQLFQLGLNWAESNEFIIYWLPILGEHPFVFIHFLTNSYDLAVPLEVSPVPDSVIRFSMRYYPLMNRPEILPEAQYFQLPTREGFVLVEWGGREIPAPKLEL